MRFVAGVAPEGRGPLGEGDHTGALAEPFRVVLGQLGLWVGGAHPGQLAVLVGRHDPGPLDLEQRLGGGDDLVQGAARPCWV